MMSETRRMSLSDPAAIGSGAAALLAGEVVAAPTETVYGLAGDATSGEAVARIYEAKGRPSFNPLICHVADVAMAEHCADLSPDARRLIAFFWPGPLTLVVPARADSPVHPLASAGLPTVALRMPVGALRDLTERVDRPIAAPSANRSGAVSPTTADHVLRTLDGRIGLVLDGGPTPHGLESTIVEVGEAGVRLLRPGPVTAADLEAALGVPVLAPDPEAALSAPGQLRSHYAPFGIVRLDAAAPEPDESWIGFGPDPDAAAHAAHRANLSPDGDLREAAANLFAILSRFDGPDFPRLAVASIPDDGLGAAINDRLRRAAAER